MGSNLPWQRKACEVSSKAAFNTGLYFPFQESEQFLISSSVDLQSLLGRDEKSKNVFYWKAGSIGILLIGALIECIANEIEDYHIWNVSTVNC
jgi:hypothetical protein